jgi:hypothetical protein
MAVRGFGYFDSRGQFFKHPDEATISDLAAMLGRVGEGDGLAPGIAKILLEKRREIEHIFADHDNMVQGPITVEAPMRRPVLVADADINVARIADLKSA